VNYLAPPQFLITVTDCAPHLLTYSSAGPGGGLTPAGVTAVNSQQTTYLSAAKLAALARESIRYQGPPTLPAAIVTATNGSWPVAAADIAAQVSALQAVIASNAS
jgi:hypothetical protein